MRYNLITRSNWNPLAQMLKDFEEEFYGNGNSQNRDSLMLSPKMEWRETADAFHLSFDLPGLDENDIKIDLKENQLIVQAERKQSFERKDGDSVRTEKHYGLYSRTLDLPLNIDEGRIEADYKNGVLEINVPKAEKAKAKSISIKAKNSSQTAQ